MTKDEEKQLLEDILINIEKYEDLVKSLLKIKPFIKEHLEELENDRNNTTLK